MWIISSIWYWMIPLITIPGKDFIDREEPILLPWNKIFLTLSMAALSLDVFFFYLLGIDNHRKCLMLDVNLERVIITFCSVVDFFLITPCYFSFSHNFSCFLRYKNLFLYASWRFSGNSKAVFPHWHSCNTSTPTGDWHSPFQWTRLFLFVCYVMF